MSEKTLDVNPAAASSAAASTGTISLNDGKGAASSSAQPGEASGDVKTNSEPTTLQEVVEATLQAQSKPDASADSGIQKLNPTEEGDTGETSPKEEQTEGEESPEVETEGEEVEGEDPTKPVPYKRFQEVIGERNSIKSELEVLKPIAETHQSIVKFCDKNDISEEQFRTFMHLAAKLNKQPEEGVKALQSLLSEFGAGETLPDDLQKDVDSGDLSLERAKELASYRMQTKKNEVLGKQRMERVAKERADREMLDIQRACVDWEANARKTDPDYKPKVNGQSDGKWELVRDKFVALVHEQQDGRFVNRVDSPEVATALLQKAYEAVSDSFGRFQPKAQARQSLSSKDSRKPAQKEPTSLRELVELKLKQAS